MVAPTPALNQEHLLAPAVEQMAGARVELVDDAQWRSQIEQLAERVREWTGNHAGIVEISERDLPRLRRDRPPVVEEVSTDAIDLGGKPAWHLLARSR